MIPHALDALAEIRRYLDAEILPAVPAALRSELRAAIKILEAAGAELNALPALLPRECEELDALNKAMARVLGRSDVAPPVGADFSSACDLRTRLAQLAERQQRTAIGLAALQQRLSEDPAATECATLLARGFETLGRHAEARIAWQSVFAGPFDVDTTP